MIPALLFLAALLGHLETMLWVWWYYISAGIKIFYWLWLA